MDECEIDSQMTRYEIAKRQHNSPLQQVLLHVEKDVIWPQIFVSTACN